VLLVPFTLSYSLNTHYDDGSQAYEQWMAYTQATDDARTSATQQALKSASQVRTSNMTVIGLLAFYCLSYRDLAGVEGVFSPKMRFSSLLS